MQMELISSLYQHRKYAEIAETVHKVLKENFEQLGNHHPRIASSLTNLAALYKALGKYEQSEPLFKKALKIYESAYGAAHAAVNNSVNYLGGICYFQKSDQEIPTVSNNILAVNLDHHKNGHTNEEWTAIKRKMILIWENVIHPDYPYVVCTNILSMTFLAQGVEHLAQFLERELVDYSYAEDWDNISNLLQNWKHYCQPGEATSHLRAKSIHSHFNGKNGRTPEEDDSFSSTGFEGSQCEDLKTEETDDQNWSAADEVDKIASKKNQANNLEDLEKIIPSKDRKKFIKKLFHKNENHYNEKIKLLNQIPTWQEASKAIETHFKETDINPYSKLALEFSNMVYRRYYPKDVYTQGERKFV